MRAHETMILFTVGGTTFAIAAGAVEEIRELSGLQEFNFGLMHPKLSKVMRVLERDNGPCFVVDSGAHFHLASASPSRLMVLRHAPVAVMVDAIEGMQDIHLLHELPDAFSGEERNWYRGLTLIKGKVVPVVRPEAFLSKAEATLLRASLRGSQAAKRIAVTA